MNLHFETVKEAVLKVLDQLMRIEGLKSFRLVGGTALALQFGHRSSVDIDLFAGGRVDTGPLLEILRSHFTTAFKLISQNRNGLTGTIDNIKVDIVDWKVPFSQEPIQINEIRMATAPDIFAYKCEAVLDRKAEKDFVDLAIIASHFELDHLLSVLKSRYPYISTGSICSFLLRKEIIIRDHTTHYFQNFSFDKSADILKDKIISYERKLQEKKGMAEDEWLKKIQSIIELKKSKKKS